MRVPMRLFYASVPVGALLVMINMIRGQGGSFRERLRDGVAIVAASGVAYWIFVAEGIPAPAWDPGTVVGIGVIVLILLGAPVAFSIIFSAIVGFWLSGATPLSAVPHQMENGADSFLLLAVPFFLLAGQFMNDGGITARLVALATNLVGHITGGLAHVNILSSFLIGGLSGSAAGDAAGLTKVLVPEMERRGYKREFCCAVTANAAVIDNLIPPAATMMIYGAVASVSVPRIFMAGIVPGMLLTVALMVAAQIMSVRRGYKGLEHRATVREMARSLKGAFWAIPMPFLILGGMRAGVVTPTEAAGVAVVYAFIVGAFVYKELKLRDLPRTLLQAGMETCMVMLILAASQPFGWVLTAEQIPQQAAQFVISLSQQPSCRAPADQCLLVDRGPALGSESRHHHPGAHLGADHPDDRRRSRALQHHRDPEPDAGFGDAARRHPGVRNVHHRPRLAGEGVSRVRTVPRGWTDRARDRHVRARAEPVVAQPSDGRVDEVSESGRRRPGEPAHGVPKEGAGP